MKIARQSEPGPSIEVYVAAALVFALFAVAFGLTWKLARKKLA